VPPMSMPIARVVMIPILPYGRVSSSDPRSVTTSVCSNCAVSPLSRVVTERGAELLTLP